MRAIDLQTRQISSPLLTDGDFGPMDYDASTGEIYLPDRKQQRIDILAPIDVTGSSLVHEPRRILSFAAAPQSVAITSDGQLGFIALEDGNIAMLDVPGRQIITTIHVGGNPHFLITGLYPSLFNFSPQQFSLLSLLENSLHYIAAAIVLVTAIIAIAVQKYREKRSANRGKDTI